MLTLALKSISEKKSRGFPFLVQPIRRPLRLNTYDLCYYIQGYLIFRVDTVDLLNPEWTWPVLFLATRFADREHFLDPLRSRKYADLSIPEGAGELSFSLSEDALRIREGLKGRTAEVGYNEFLDTSRRFAEDVRTTMLDMNPKFAEHRELGEWFRTPQADA